MNKKYRFNYPLFFTLLIYFSLLAWFIWWLVT